MGSFAGFAFGIVALIVGAFVNFGLNRRRDALLRAEEARSVAAAIFGEIILIRKELARTARLVAQRAIDGRDFDKHLLEVIRLQEPILYKALANKLGLLNPKLLLAIADFYANLELVRSWLPHIIENEERKFEYSPLSVLEPAILAVDSIKPVLDALATEMRVPASDEVDLARARGYAEFERERFAD